jgi:hypothetical protein
MEDVMKKRQIRERFARRHLAHLLPVEEKAWDSSFAFHINNGLADKDAAERTWEDLQREFPRLSKYDGCQA